MSDDNSYDAETAPFRQPMVTSIGIVLGFLLAFLANWAAEANAEPALSTASDYVIALALLASAALFTTALFRLLDNRVHANPGMRYQTSFRIYILAFLLAFIGLAVALLI
jgi:uncharacterized membrane protein